LAERKKNKLIIIEKLCGYVSSMAFQNSSMLAREYAMWKQFLKQIELNSQHLCMYGDMDLLEPQTIMRMSE